MMSEKQFVKFKEAEVRASGSVKETLNELSKVNADEIMELIEELVSGDNTVAFRDNHSIHLKVDRRKNIDKIKEEVEGSIRQLLIDKAGFDNADMLIRVKTGNNMIIIKRRR